MDEHKRSYTETSMLMSVLVKTWFAMGFEEGLSGEEIIIAAQSLIYVVKEVTSGRDAGSIALSVSTLVKEELAKLDARGIQIQ